MNSPTFAERQIRELQVVGGGTHIKDAKEADLLEPRAAPYHTYGTTHIRTFDGYFKLVGVFTNLRFKGPRDRSKLKSIPATRFSPAPYESTASKKGSINIGLTLGGQALEVRAALDKIRVLFRDNHLADAWEPSGFAFESHRDRAPVADTQQLQCP